MTRFLYRLLLVLHPTRFRERFGNEMLAVFDDARTSRSGVSLVLSLVWSLIRQRLLRRPPPHVLPGIDLSEPLQRAWDLRRGLQRVDRQMMWTSWPYVVAAMFVIHLAGFGTVNGFPRSFLAMGLVMALLEAYGYRKRQVRTAVEYRADLRADELDGKLDAIRRRHCPFGTGALVIGGIINIVFLVYLAWDMADRGNTMYVVGLLAAMLVLNIRIFKLSKRLTRLIQQEADLLGEDPDLAG